MARVTVDDCLTPENNNRFELIMLASRRARQLQQGASAFVPLDRDKPTVVALREIAEGFIDTSKLDQIDEEHKMAVVQREIAEAQNTAITGGF